MQQPDAASRANLPAELCQRSYAMEEWEFRDNETTGGWTFHGTASVVEHPYHVNDQFGSYTEIMRTGAFDRSLKDMSKPISLFVNHQSKAIPLASRASGMQLVADPHLRVKAELNSKRTDVQDVRHAIEDGILREMSIGFKPVKSQDRWSNSYQQVDRHQVTIREVSIVEAGMGANTGGTAAEMRSMDELLDADPASFTQDEIRRAAAYFNGLVVPDEPIVELFAERDRLDRERLERLRACA